LRGSYGSCSLFVLIESSGKPNLIDGYCNHRSFKRAKCSSQLPNSRWSPFLVAAMPAGGWVNLRTLRRAQESGDRYWPVDLLSALARLRGIEPLVFILALLAAVAAIGGLIALQ
jgi:hypothetical protein